MRRRLLAGMGANSFGMAITVGIQLVSLPLFLHYWDITTYGTWLLISAVPTYLSMADIGMVAVAGNRMTMAMAAGNRGSANAVFQSAQYFMAMVCGCIALLLVPLALCLPASALTDGDHRMALVYLSVGVLFALFGGLTEQVFKSTGRYATGTILGNMVRLAEWGGFMVGLVCLHSFAGVSAVGLAARVLGTLVGMYFSQRGDHGLSWGVRCSEWAEIRAMVKPAFSFMAFALANALSFQGVTLIVGTLFCPATVALFNTYRTIARIAVQLNAVFSFALWPEFSRLFGQSAGLALQTLYRQSVLLGAVQALVLSAVLYFLSPWLLQVWTQGRIQYLSSPMFLMLLYAAVGGMWHTPKIFLMATNQHVALAPWFVASGLLVVGLVWLMGRMLALNGVGFALLGSELCIAAICARLAHCAVARGVNQAANQGTQHP